MNFQRLERITLEWKRQLILREFIFALGAGILVVALLLWLGHPFHWKLPLAVLLGTLGIRLGITQPWGLDPAHISRHLNRTCPELEESAALFLRSREQLTLVERLQADRISRTISERFAAHDSSAARLGVPPRNFLRFSALCLAGGISLTALIGTYQTRHPAKSSSAASQINLAPNAITPPANPALSPPKIVNNTFTITPPAYTGHQQRQVDGFTAEVEEGSTVVWNILLDQPAPAAHLVAGSVNIPLYPGDGQNLAGTATVNDANLFALLGATPDGKVWNPPELFSIKVVKDQPPTVRLHQPMQTRTEIVPPAPATLVIEAAISDDYAVADAHLVATVAKGSGESVKFREQTIPFDTDSSAESPNVHRYTKSLDLSALGMEPGDELYFFVEAHDNRQPTANRARSESRFLLLRGPEAKATTTGRGIAGVNLIPQYFRSERQLIIDTERLIADHPTLSDAEVRARANDLGADQALLRLRYGRFLGEDQEDSPLTDHLENHLDPLQAAPPSNASGPHAAASIAQRFAQEHIAQDRDGGGDDTTPRGPVNGMPLQADQVRQPFVDSHDQQDKNTFFDTETKGTMRDALDAMWKAEGFLRTIRPQEALAPEHRALDILKDLQQSVRAYVQHVGFEAPPLKVTERRLKGDAAGVPPRASSKNLLSPPDPAISAVRHAVAALSQSATISTDALTGVEPALTAAAIRQPDDFLPGLQALRRLRAGSANPEQEQTALQSALLRLLPPVNALPRCMEEPAPGLAARYLGTLQGAEALP